LIILLVAALAVLVAPATAAAAQIYSDTVSGYEYAFTSMDGRFAGTASGALPGAWNADVQHTRLCLSCTPTATVTGGSFSLATTHNGFPALVSGAFVGGTVQATNVGSNCSNQTFAVKGILGQRRLVVERQRQRHLYGDTYPLPPFGLRELRHLRCFYQGTLSLRL
jgi:hypothetical protein